LSNRAGSSSSKQRPHPIMTSVLHDPAEPASPLTPSTQMSEPLSPCTPAPALAMSHEQVEALWKRFNRFAEGSGVRGVLFYPQFITMICDLFRIPTPQAIHQKRINHLWKEIDVETCGRVNFETFCNWYLKYFDAPTGSLAKGLPRMLRC